MFMHRIGFRRTRARTRARARTRTRTQRSGTRTRTRWLFELRRCRSLIEAVWVNLGTNWPDCYSGTTQSSAFSLS